MSTNLTQTLFNQIKEQIHGKYLLGSSEFIEWLLTAYLSRGHLLVEGPPGTAKTLSAKILARTLSRNSKRIQFTTDMLPSDILGAYLYNPADQNFKFIKGPIFTDFLIADEINRTPPRTQSALLEAMEEGQVTIEGVEHKLGEHFFVMATQNPQDFEGTFPLPEVEMDRFLFKLVVRHSEPETEVALFRHFLSGQLPPVFENVPEAKFDRKKIEEEINSTRVDDSILSYIAGILKATRVHPMLDYGSSARGGLALVKGARILARKQGRDFVVPDDIKRLSHVALRHRIRLNSEAQLSGMSDEAVIEEIMQKVPFPT